MGTKDNPQVATRPPWAKQGAVQHPKVGPALPGRATICDPTWSNIPSPVSQVIAHEPACRQTTAPSHGLALQLLANDFHYHQSPQNQPRTTILPTWSYGHICQTTPTPNHHPAPRWVVQASPYRWNGIHAAKTHEKPNVDGPNAKMTSPSGKLLVQHVPGPRRGRQIDQPAC